MATFNEFSNILPDPNNSIANDGSSGSGNAGYIAGPGFASVDLKSNQPYLMDTTNSGRLLARAIVSHKWEISINYNPMTRDEFDPVYSFLLQRRGPINPFFVSLPQNRVPKDSTFASFASATNLTSQGSYAAGQTQILIGNGSYTSANGTPKPGDLFTFNAANSNHKKAYMVTRVETPTDYQTGTTAPTANQVRIHFTPGLQKSIVVSDEVIFSNPLIRCILKSNIQEYSLNTNNLYSFSLKLEEVQ